MTVCCLSLSIWSWLSMRHAYFPEDAIHIFGLVFSIFVTAAIACRSSFWADRVVFGAVAIAFVIAMVEATIALAPPVLLAVNAAKSFMWTIAALVSLVVLVRQFSRA
jgi:hypothetical protein